MRRREFMTLLGVAAAWPLTTRAEHRIPVIAFLRSARLDETPTIIRAFSQGLGESGFVEGQNVTIEFRSAEDRPERLPTLAAELVRERVSIIVGNGIAMLAAKAATAEIPIVFAVGGDPVQQGLVTTLNRPGGNVTGVHFFGGILGGKRMEVLSQLVPNGEIGVLVFPNAPTTEAERQEVLAAAQALQRELIVVDVSSTADVDTAFVTFVQRGAAAVLVGAGAFMTAHRKQIVGLAARHALPAIYHLRASVKAGGLISYGASIVEAYRQAGIYTGRILKGEKPGDLPVLRSTKFELVINLKTAKALGIMLPPTLLATADEVIE